MELEPDIHLKEQFSFSIRYWWIIAVCGLLGALSGIGFSRLHQPIYEAHSVLLIGNDISSLDKSLQNANTKDYISSKGSDIFTNEDIKNQVIKKFAAQGSTLTLKDFSVEKQITRWDLVVQNQDPNIAAEAANFWLDLSIQALDEAHSHSVKVVEISTKINILSNCSSQTQTSSICSSIPDNIQILQEIENLTPELALEERASKGITIFFSFEKGDLAKVPVRPVVFGRNNLVMIATILGLLVGVWITFSGYGLRSWRRT